MGRKDEKRKSEGKGKAGREDASMDAPSEPGPEAAPDESGRDEQPKKPKKDKSKKDKSKKDKPKKDKSKKDKPKKDKPKAEQEVDLAPDAGPRVADPTRPKRVKPEKRGKKGKRERLTAANADRHDLYQRSVQNPEEELRFIARIFGKLRARRAVSLREDFCGTALLSATWVRLDPGARSALGLDIDPSVLAWARRHNLEPLGEAASRLELVQQDVRDPTAQKFDVITAFNFSYWTFKSRPTLRQYFQAVHRSLESDGVFFLDAYGGWEAHEPMEERRSIKGGFTYVWEQSRVDPIENGIVNHIHFHFKDGSKLRKAFTYEWRLWSLPEIKELLEEAGFTNVLVFWDDADEGEAENYQPRKRAANQPGWLAYIVACK